MPSTGCGGGRSFRRVWTFGRSRALAAVRNADPTDVATLGEIAAVMLIERIEGRRKEVHLVTPPKHVVRRSSVGPGRRQFVHTGSVLRAFAFRRLRQTPGPEHGRQIPGRFKSRPYVDYAFPEMSAANHCTCCSPQSAAGDRLRLENAARRPMRLGVDDRVD